MGRKRTRIGLVYAPTSNWIAGAYYVENIAKALLTCEDSRLPHIVLYCNSNTEFEQFRERTGYPYLQMRTFYCGNRYVNALRRRANKYLGIPFDEPERYPCRQDSVKFAYPFYNFSNAADVTKVLGWIPDFQEKYLPQLFSQDDLMHRNRVHQSYIDNMVPLVFSSEDARSDFFKFLPDGKRLKTFVLPFAVTHPDFSHEDIHELQQKHGITKRYLFCANQFWKHKNHLFLFSAFAKARQKGFDAQLVCSGKLLDYRDDDYVASIRAFIRDNGLENDILLLGFMERTEQLCLMDNAYAIIQPSLFEGWSTVVEDAKCLNKFVYLSNLRVHQEQMTDNVCFFDPHDESDLVNKLLTVKPEVTKHDYKDKVKAFGEQFLSIIEQF